MVGGWVYYLLFFAKPLLIVFLPLHMLPCFYKHCSDVWGFSWLQGVILRSAIHILSSSLALDSIKIDKGSENREESCVVPTLQVGNLSTQRTASLTVMESEEKPTIRTKLPMICGVPWSQGQSCVVEWNQALPSFVFVLKLSKCFMSFCKV